MPAANGVSGVGSSATEKELPPELAREARLRFRGTRSPVLAILPSSGGAGRDWNHFSAGLWGRGATAEALRPERGREARCSLNTGGDKLNV